MDNQIFTAQDIIAMIEGNMPIPLAIDVNGNEIPGKNMSIGHYMYFDMDQQQKADILAHFNPVITNVSICTSKGHIKFYGFINDMFSYNMRINLHFNANYDLTSGIPLITFAREDGFEFEIHEEIYSIEHEIQLELKANMLEKTKRRLGRSDIKLTKQEYYPVEYYEN